MSTFGKVQDVEWKMAAKQTKQKTWSNEMMQDLASKGKYLSISTNRGLLLKTAPANWKKHADAVYVPELRVVGSPAEIRSFFPGQDVSAYIANGYSLANYKSEPWKSRMAAEVAAAPVAAKKPRAAAATIPLSALQAAAAAGRDAPGGIKFVTQSLSPKVPKPRTGRTTDLSARLATATAAGKFLDISDITSTGTGVRTGDRPGANSQRFYVEGLNISSKTGAAYAMAVARLNRADGQAYVDAFMQAERSRPAGVKSPKAIASPFAGRQASPRQASPPRQVAALPRNLGSPPASPRGQTAPAAVRLSPRVATRRP